MTKYILTIILILTFSACTKQPLEYSSKKYKDIDKNAVLNAAKRVVRLSDSDFRVYSKRNSVEASKTNVIYKGFTPDIRVSKITLETYYEDRITKAKLIITQNKNYNDKKTSFASRKEYDFFWRRMDYILGLNKVWESCYSHMLNNEAVLCDFIYNENNNAKISNIIADTSIFVQEEVTQEDNSIITQIDLTVLDEIELPFHTDTTKKKTINPLEDEVSNEIPQNDDMEVIEIK